MRGRQHDSVKIAGRGTVEPTLQVVVILDRAVRDPRAVVRVEVHILPLVQKGVGRERKFGLVKEAAVVERHDPVRAVEPVPLLVVRVSHRTLEGVGRRELREKHALRRHESPLQGCEH